MHKIWFAFALLFALALGAVGERAYAASFSVSDTITVKKASLVWQADGTYSVMASFVNSAGQDRGQGRVDIRADGTAWIRDVQVGTVPGAFLTTTTSLGTYIDTALTTLANNGKFSLQ